MTPNAASGCTNPIDVGCFFEDVISKASNDALQELTNRVMEGLGKAVASLGTMWVDVPTPVLVAGDGSTAGGGLPPGSSEFATILGYVTYVGLTVAVLSLIALGALIAVRIRRGEGLRNLGTLGIILLSVLLISGASALVGGLLGSSAPGGSASAVGFLQNSLWFYVGGLAVLSVIVGGIRMAWEQRAQPGRDLLQSLITLVLVSGAGLAVLALAVTAADAFSVWVLNSATDCDVSAAGQSQCFGTNVGAMIALTSQAPIGLIGVLILGSIALLMTFVQVALMVIRGGLLVILAGVLPLTASFTNTQMGRQWFAKTIGWTIAFVLYKPAAALVYAAAFQLVGSDAFQKDGGGLYSILTGMALMLVALLALPALLRFVAPMTGALSSSGGGGMALAAAGGAAGGELATGAIRSRMSSPSGGGGGAESSPSGAQPSGPPPSSSARAGSGAGGVPVPAGAGPTAEAAAPAGAGPSAGAGAAASSSDAAAAGGTAAGAAAAGPVAPIVLGAKLASDAAAAGAKAAKGATQSAVNDSTGQ